VALRILLADDSMTAQNMGKKILSEGGYEVIAVSNGAAALKKIAEQKPDIVVLDIYMPGYSGLEVCERLKNTIETSRVPVLLTVGKLEPFRPEDAVRVRAEGVIIKPFEASELLAVIEKAASHIVKPVPVVPKPQHEEFAEEEDFTEQMGASLAALEDIEVPKDVADAPAFGLDEMVRAISTSAPDAETLPKFEASSLDDFETRIRMEDEPSVESTASLPSVSAVAEAVAATSVRPESEFETESAPSFTSAGGDPLLESRDNSGPVNATIESEVFFDNPDPGEVHVARDPNLWVDDSTGAVETLPELEVTAQREPEPVDAVTDPALIARENLMSEVTNFPEEYREIDDDLICESEPQVEAEPATVEKLAPAEDDFDALVSAALAKFEPETETEVEQERVVATRAWRAEATSLDQSERSLSLEREMQIAMAVASGAGFSVPASPTVVPAMIGSSANGNGVGMLEVHEPPIVEEEMAEVPEAAVAVGEPEESTPQATAEPEPQVVLGAEERVELIAEPQVAEPITPEQGAITEPAPQLSEASVAGAMLGQVVGQPKDPLEQERLVEAIGRVLERLKPQIVSELAKELKNKE
jgi:CheY-like chemotaxis protein